ncbi:acyltransferase family protein [Sphingomonas sp.]
MARIDTGIDSGLRDDVGRGLLLGGILYVHFVIAFAQTRTDPMGAVASFVQIKLLASHVAVFFVLAGMGARHIARRGWRSVTGQSLMLVVLAAFSHAIGYWIGPFVHNPPMFWGGAVYGLVKPIVSGTGYATFVAWFFVSLATARLLAYWIARGWRGGLAAVALYTLAILGLRAAGFPDNAYEWRTVPIATLLFLIGMRIGRDWHVGSPLGLAALLVSLALGWFNRPGLLATGPCLDCDLFFVAQPLVGQHGSLPVFVVQELAFAVFILASARWLILRGLAAPIAFLGRNAMPLLLLHGWVLVGVLPWLLPRMPPRESAILFPIVAVASWMGHVALLWALRRPVEWLLILANRIARAMLDRGERLVRSAGLGRERPAA